VPFVFDVTEDGTCPLATADSRIVCNERRRKCSVNIYSVLVLVSDGDDVLPRQTVMRVLNSIYWGERFFDPQPSVNGVLPSCESHPKASVVGLLSVSGLLGKA